MYYSMPTDRAEQSLAGLHGDADPDAQLPGVDLVPFKSRCIQAGGAPRVDPRTGRMDSGVESVIVCRNDKGEVYESVTYSDGVQILKLPRYGVPKGKILTRLYDAGGSQFNSSFALSRGDQLWYKGSLTDLSYSSGPSGILSTIESWFS